MKSNQWIERAKVLCSEFVAPKTKVKTKFQTELRFCKRREPRENVVFRVSSRVPLTRDSPKWLSQTCSQANWKTTFVFFKEWLTKSIIFLTFTERSRVIWRTGAREACNCFTASSSIVTRIGMTETLMWYRCGRDTLQFLTLGRVWLCFDMKLAYPLIENKNYWNSACVALWCLLLGVCIEVL